MFGNSWQLCFEIGMWYIDGLNWPVSNLQGGLQNAFNLHDSCGVHNLHGMPGLLSSFLSAFYCGIASKDSYGDA